MIEINNTVCFLGEYLKIEINLCVDRGPNIMDDIKLDRNMPIYIQIMNLIRRRIASKDLKAGERIPSVRELATQFGVNPNTMQRALSELEKENLLCAERTSGRFVTTNSSLIEELRIQEARDAVNGFRCQMEALGFTKEMAADFFIRNSEGEIKVG